MKPSPDLTPSTTSTRILVVALLALLAILLFASARQESQVFDESDHIFAGFEYWKHGDFGRNPEHPPLAKMLATLPLLRMGLKEPPVLHLPFFKAQDFINGTQLLYSADADAILMRSRMVIGLFSLGLALLVFFAAKQMFNPLTGLFALTLFTFEPTLLANGALVTTDMPLSFFFFASVFAFYLYVRKPSWMRFTLCAVSAALAMVTKHSGVLILPILFLLALTEFFLTPRPLNGEATPFGVRLRRIALLLVAMLVVSYGVLWAIYGFRYAARPGQLQIIPPLAAYAAGLTHPMQRTVLTFFANHHLLPEAYLYGWVDILLIPGQRTTFLFGHVFPTGQWFYFPAVFIIKATLSLIILLLLLPFARVQNRRREFIFLALPALFYLATAISSMLNLGIRHLLPIFPFLIVLAGAAAAVFFARSLVARVAVSALLLLAIASSLHAFPDFLAYSNEAFGGPSRTYRVVTDSNDDWGQGLKWTKAYLDKNQVSDCWLDYNDPFLDPSYYGIHCHPLPSGFGSLVGIPSPTVPTTISGTVLISATEATGLLWGPDTLNPYQSFFNRKPDAMIGNAILVYRGSFPVPLIAAETNASSALTLARQHRFVEAVTLAQTAVQQAPDNADINATLGEVLHAAGHTAEAKQANATALHLAQTIHPEYQKQLIALLQHP